MNSFFECDSKSFFKKKKMTLSTETFLKIWLISNWLTDFFFFSKKYELFWFFEMIHIIELLLDTTHRIQLFFIRLKELNPFFSHMTLRIHHFFENTSHRNQSFTDMTHKMKPFVFKMTQRIEPLSFLNMTQRLNWSSFEYYSQSSF